MPGNPNKLPFTQPTWLAGIRILDLSRLLPGPYATQLAADLGAEVIKVEQAGVGDNMRYYPPFYDGEKSRDRLSALFVSVNQGKKSVTLNLKSGSGKARPKPARDREQLGSLALATPLVVFEGQRDTTCLVTLHHLALRQPDGRRAQQRDGIWAFNGARVRWRRN